MLFKGPFAFKICFIYKYINNFSMSMKFLIFYVLHFLKFFKFLLTSSRFEKDRVIYITTVTQYTT